MLFRIIAIDGPAGAGKSTVAKEVARRLGYLFLDSGALYRAVALHFLRGNAVLQDSASVCAALCQLDLKLDQNGQVLLAGKSVEEEIRSRKISQIVSTVAQLPAVRKKLLEYQQHLASGQGLKGQPKGLVAEGRDMGTVVFPNADFKVFLTADLTERAKRRQKEFAKHGQALPLDQWIEDIQARDAKDSQRALAPLLKADDAMEIDTTGLSIEQTIQAILRVVHEGLANP